MKQNQKKCESNINWFGCSRFRCFARVETKKVKSIIIIEKNKKNTIGKKLGVKLILKEINLKSQNEILNFLGVRPIFVMTQQVKFKHWKSLLI